MGTPRGGATPRQGGSMTPRRDPGGMFPPPSPGQGSRGGHRGGDMWGAAAEAWGGSGGRGRRTPGQGRGGYNSTPHYDDRSTPRYGSSGGRTPGSAGGRTPASAGGRTPQDRRGPRGHYGD